MAINNPYSAYLFDVDEEESDPTIETMNPHEYGAFCRLRNKSWRQKPVGSIPNDDRVLALWAHMTPDEWSECRSAALAPFEELKGNRLSLPRIVLEFRKLMEKRKAKSDAGKAGAGKRWHSHDKAIVDPCECYSTAIAEDSKYNPKLQTLNSLTPNLKETNNPKGGLGGTSDVDPVRSEPRVLYEDSFEGSGVQGLSVVDVFAAFEKLLSSLGMHRNLDLSKKSAHCKVDPAQWVMLLLDKVQYAYADVDGKPRMEVEDVDPVALTVSGFRPRKGNRQYPTDSARAYFLEVLEEFVKYRDGKRSRWEQMQSGPYVGHDLTKRKGKR